MKYQFSFQKLESGIVGYCQVRADKVYDTVEIKEGRIIADYNSSGKLVGIEFLDFCDVEVPDDRKDL